MIFTIKRPKSKRFFQLSFEGFKPGGRTKFDKLLKSWTSFLRSLYTYLARKLWNFILFIVKSIRWLARLPSYIKNFVVRKLIWSRGKLGRPVVTIVVISIGFIVFLFGEVFSSFTFVIDKQVNADYLSNTSDIIPKKEIATTTIPDIRKRTEPFVYVVEGGDTLSGIGEKFKVSVDALKYVNSLTDYTILKVGQEVTIPPVSGLIHTVKSGDTLNSIAEKYDVPPQAIADFNYVLDTSKLASGTELVIPGAKVPEPVLPPVYTPPAALVPSTGGTATPSKSFCVWPTTTRIITQYFAWYHNGVDIATPWGRAMPPLFACTGGRVVRAGWDPFGLGLHVRIDHGNGYETVYGHMSRIDVGFGQRVSRGQVIGLMGNTGRSTGPHVHFTVNFNGVSQNPMNYTN